MDRLLGEWEAARDYRAVFLISYRAITVRMSRAVAQEEFEDSDWVAELDVRFARLYFDALASYDSEEGDLPVCWKIAFDLAHQRRTSVLQDLLLGMNAHIRRDLPVALAGMGLLATERPQRLRDHNRVNEILAGMIGSVQDEVSGRYSLILKYLDRLAGPNDEILTALGLRRAREEAWKMAVALSDVRSDEERSQLVARLDADAAELALRITSVGPVARLIPWIRPIDGLLARLRGRAPLPGNVGS